MSFTSPPEVSKTPEKETDATMNRTSPLTSLPSAAEVELHYISSLKSLFKLHKKRFSLNATPLLQGENTTLSKGESLTKLHKGRFGLNAARLHQGKNTTLSKGIIQFFFSSGPSLTEPQKTFVLDFIHQSLTVGIPSEEQPSQLPTDFNWSELSSFYQEIESYLLYPKDHRKMKVYWKGFSRFLRVIRQGLNCLSNLFLNFSNDDSHQNKSENRQKVPNSDSLVVAECTSQRRTTCYGIKLQRKAHDQETPE